MLYKLILSFESVEETLVCDHSNMVLFINKKNENKNKTKQNKTKQNKNKETWGLPEFNTILLSSSSNELRTLRH